MHDLPPFVIKVFLVSVATVSVAYIVLLIGGTWYDERFLDAYSNLPFEGDDGTMNCTIGVVAIQGAIDSYDHDPSSVGPVPLDDGSVSQYGEEVISLLRDMAYWGVDGVLLKIDSPGGVPAMSEAIMREVQSLPVPVAALIRDYGASGAYLVATGADTIIASPFSTVGSIGVTMSYLDNSEKNKTDGIRYVDLSSGPFKDSGSPDKPLTEAEYALFKRDLDYYHSAFVNLVAENRHMSVEDVQALADGSAMPGELALEKGLVDKLGDEFTAQKWFSDTLGVPESEVVFCE